MSVSNNNILYNGTTAYDLRKVSSVWQDADVNKTVYVRFIDDPKNFVSWDRDTFETAWQLSLNQSGANGSTGIASFSASTLLTANSPGYIRFTGSTGSQTITMPAANMLGANMTRLFVIRNSSSVTVAVARSGTDTLTIGASAGLTTTNVLAGASLELLSDGVSIWENVG